MIYQVGSQVGIPGVLLAAAALSLPLAAHAADGPDGKIVFETRCAPCHQLNGEGAVGLAPPLTGTLGKRLSSPVGRKYLAGVLVTGMAGKIESKGVTYNGIMPTWQALPDEELAAVLNYVLTTFNAADLPASHEPYQAAEFSATRVTKPAAKDLRAWRAESEPAAAK